MIGRVVAGDSQGFPLGSRSASQNLASLLLAVYGNLTELCGFDPKQPCE